MADEMVETLTKTIYNVEVGVLSTKKEGFFWNFLKSVLS